LTSRVGSTGTGAIADAPRSSQMGAAARAVWDANTTTAHERVASSQRRMRRGVMDASGRIVLGPGGLTREDASTLTWPTSSYIGTIGPWQQSLPSSGTRQGRSAFPERSAGCGCSAGWL